MKLILALLRASRILSGVRPCSLFSFSARLFILAPIVQLLVPHVNSVFELVQKVLADDNSGEPLDKLAYGVIGDLADAFPNGEIKPLLLAEWIASSLVLRKGYDKETKTTVKWAREVTFIPFQSLSPYT